MRMEAYQELKKLNSRNSTKLAMPFLPMENILFLPHAHALMEWAVVIYIFPFSKTIIGLSPSTWVQALTVQAGIVSPYLDWMACQYFSQVQGRVVSVEVISG